MKKVLAIVLAVSMMLVFAAPALADTVATRDLVIDGGDTRTVIGDITVDCTGGVISVTYNEDDDQTWDIVDTHVYIDDTVPSKHSPGKFPYKAGDSSPVFASGTMVYIAFHAEVAMLDGAGNPLLDDYDQPIYETAWAQWETVTPADDTLFRGNSGSGKGNAWATFFTITVP